MTVKSHKTAYWLNVECPRCHASVGKRCPMPYGAWNFVVHSIRRSAALAAGFKGKEFPAMRTPIPKRRKPILEDRLHVKGVSSYCANGRHRFNCFAIDCRCECHGCVFEGRLIRRSPIKRSTKPIARSPIRRAARHPQVRVGPGSRMIQAHRQGSRGPTALLLGKKTSINVSGMAVGAGADGSGDSLIPVTWRIAGINGCTETPSITSGCCVQSIT